MALMVLTIVEDNTYAQMLRLLKSCLMELVFFACEIYLKKLFLLS